MSSENNPNPYEPGSSSPATNSESNAKSTGTTSTIYKHFVALLGAMFVFVAAFIAVALGPAMISNAVASSRTWMTVSVIGAVVLGLVAAGFSYASTLRVYSK
ncbi:MAG: hypothetical protein AAFN77_22450 [Planctomycetota bacterium]